MHVNYYYISLSFVFVSLYHRWTQEKDKIYVHKIRKNKKTKNKIVLSFCSSLSNEVYILIVACGGHSDVVNPKFRQQQQQPTTTTKQQCSLHFFGSEIDDFLLISCFFFCFFFSANFSIMNIDFHFTSPYSPEKLNRKLRISI